jgi:hypothetical protein
MKTTLTIGGAVTHKIRDDFLKADCSISCELDPTIEDPAETLAEMQELLSEMYDAQIVQLLQKRKSFEG